MPERQTLERARRDAREGKAPSTQAGEFVREEMEHIREGKHGARSTKQAIAIGLSKARRAGVKLAAPKGAEVSPRARKQAKRDVRRGSSAKPSAKRSRATLRALKKKVDPPPHTGRWPRRPSVRLENVRRAPDLNKRSAQPAPVAQTGHPMDVRDEKIRTHADTRLRSGGHRECIPHGAEGTHRRYPQ